MNRAKYIGSWKVLNSIFFPPNAPSFELFCYIRYDLTGEERARILEEAIEIDEPCWFGLKTKKVWKKYCRWRAAGSFGQYEEADTVEEGKANVEKALVAQGYIIIPDKLLVME